MTTRDRILDAALECFLDQGYEHTSVSRIAERSGVSNGALFHHFPSKEAVAGALYVDAIRSAQTGQRDLLKRKPRSLRAAVRGTIDNQLRWTEENEARARFVYALGQLGKDSPARAELDRLNEELASEYREWMQPLVDAGRVRPMSMVLMTALVTGPSHSIAQRWLAGLLDQRPLAFLDELTEAAVAALSGSSSKRAPTAPAATVAKSRVQLLSDDGLVIAEGESAAPLAPPADRT